MAKILGVDPGKSGALVLLNEGSIKDKLVMPLRPDGTLDSVFLFDWIKAHSPEHIVLEKVTAMPGNGVVSMFNFGRIYGELLSLIKISQFSFTEVSPRQWAKSMHQGLDAKLKPKQKSLIAVKNLFPKESFLATSRSKVPHDGLVDATLIAEYGRRYILKSGS